jgi:predicted O-linked N-acetylglucosamine transferase (SPINDLY family)
MPDCGSICNPPLLQSAVKFDPALGVGLTELIGLISNGELATARQRADVLLQSYPDQAELWRLAAICALQQGDLVAAQKALDRALELAPNSVESWCNLASVYTAGGRFTDAERALRRALAIAPQHAAALNNLGSLLDARGDYHGAADCFAKAIVQKPDYSRAWLNQAAALLAVRQLERAESSARRAIQLAPQWPDAHLVLGNVLAALLRKDAALEAWREAARLAPDNPQFQYQFALALDEQGNVGAAQKAYESCLRAAPEFWPALSQLAFLLRRLCTWNALPPLSRRLLEGIDSGAHGITPFSMLVEVTSPAQQLACARAFASDRQTQVAALESRLAPVPRARRSGPLRVGFVAAGFGEHPTALLIAELIERLHASQVRTYGYATSTDDGGPLRKRLAAAFHEFHDMSALSLDGMLRRLRDDQPDILIDLDGYCEGSHPELFALRPAPLQVNWLAYPGTLGATWYDYLIADRFLIPPGQREYYSEKIAFLPRCYQPSDTTREIAAPTPRARHGLPENLVVFACFNHTWKYTLRSFARWTKILKSVPASVLWLLAGPPGTDQQLRRAAQAAGLDPRRLIFAPRVPHAEHLARYAHVDLFLDTNPYNAHTTASDALWAGCPVLTQPGATFASRVAGSLNHHLGLDELNTTSDQAYVDFAVRLAQNPAERQALRVRVEKGRQESSLFDMAGYARDFEAALLRMHKRFEHNQDAQDFEVNG